MAGDWIKMKTGLWDHPKVVRIVSAICPQSVRDMSERCRIIGALYRTWSLADTHTDDGVLDGYDADALDAAVGIDGWSANLQHVGWLIVEPQRLIVPRFTEHGGQTAKRRAEDAARKGRVRKMSAECPQNVRKTAEQRREEKRRDIPPLSPGERERLVFLVAGKNVHNAAEAVDAALSSRCLPSQIEDAARTSDGKALHTALTTMRPPSASATRRKAAQSREDARTSIILIARNAGKKNEEINLELAAEGLDPI